MKSIILSEISEQWKQRLKTAGKVAGGAAALGAAGYGAVRGGDALGYDVSNKLNNAANSVSEWASEKGKKLFGKKEEDTNITTQSDGTKQVNNKFGGEHQSWNRSRPSVTTGSNDENRSLKGDSNFRAKGTR